jgi:hypothetical protein
MKILMVKHAALLLIAMMVSILVDAKIWQVGTAKTYTKPSQVSGLVLNNDTVEIDAGTYLGDCTSWNKNNLLLKGVGGKAHLDANGNSSGGKAIWVISGNDVTVENIEFSGCTVPDSNGAGIRIEGVNLTVRNCYFHNNEDGILGGSSGDIIVEHSEFSNNGHGDGYSHNIYINHANSFTLRYCYMHHAIVGHEVKSRAHKNYILYNRIMNEATGTASREIDLPNGGTAIIMGNLIQQGPATKNSNMVGYGLEGLTNNAPHNLYVVNNTFVNERGAPGIFLNVQAGMGLLKVYNNLFTGPQGTLISGTSINLDTLSNLYISNISDAKFINSSIYDYRLDNASPAINRGSAAGMADTFSLTPKFEYKHLLDYSLRPVRGNLDAGAYEYDGPTVIVSNIPVEIKIINDYANQRLLIDLPTENGPAFAEIYSLDGKKIMDKNISSAEGFDLNYRGKIVSGFYLLKVWTLSHIYSEKFWLLGE